MSRVLCDTPLFNHVSPSTNSRVLTSTMFDLGLCRISNDALAQLLPQKPRTVVRGNVEITEQSLILFLVF